MIIIAAILLFGVIVFIHELGHFLFAKKAGVTIHEFSIGMGPKLYSKTKNGTKYSKRICKWCYKIKLYTFEVNYIK